MAILRIFLVTSFEIQFMQIISVSSEKARSKQLFGFQKVLAAIVIDDIGLLTFITIVAKGRVIFVNGVIRESACICLVILVDCTPEN